MSVVRMWRKGGKSVYNCLIESKHRDTRMHTHTHTHTQTATKLLATKSAVADFKSLNGSIHFDVVLKNFPVPKQHTRGV